MHACCGGGRHSADIHLREAQIISCTCTPRWKEFPPSVLKLFCTAPKKEFHAYLKEENNVSSHAEFECTSLGECHIKKTNNNNNKKIKQTDLHL